MATRNVAMTVTFVAWDTSANTGKTGDGNITVKWIKDGTVETLDTNTVTEVDATNCPGVYKVAISAAEANCNIGMLAGKSTTANIVVLPVTIQFERLPDAAPAANGGLPTVDASNHINGVQDTLSVNVTQIEGSDATDQINAACDAAIETYGLDHLVSASVAGSDVADNSIVASWSVRNLLLTGTIMLIQLRAYKLSGTGVTLLGQQAVEDLHLQSLRYVRKWIVIAHSLLLLSQTPMSFKLTGLMEVDWT